MIRKLLLLAAGVSVLTGTAAAQTNVGIGVTVDINQPGVYGRVTIGNLPPPVIYPQPVIITPRPIVVQQQPIYMKVPPGHAKKWSKHCHKYNACNQPVYFVQTAEYRGKGKGKGHGKGHKHDD